MICVSGHSPVPGLLLSLFAMLSSKIAKLQSSKPMQTNLVSYSKWEVGIGMLHHLAWQIGSLPVASGLPLVPDIQWPGN